MSATPAARVIVRRTTFDATTPVIDVGERHRGVCAGQIRWNLLKVFLDGNPDRVYDDNC